MPITPIGNFPYLDDNKPNEREQVLMMCINLLSKCDEVWCAGDYVSEGMRAEIRAALRLGKPVYSVGMDQKKIQDAISGLKPLLEARQCVDESERCDFKGRLIIIKPAALAPWALEPENQLWVASHGNGCYPTTIGRSVFAINICDGDRAQFDRADIYGIADTDLLPSWAKNAYRQYQEEQKINESINESEEPEL
jgi:hypothetical protein